MEGLNHPMIAEKRAIGAATARKHKRYCNVKNPLTGSLLLRQIKRAIYCTEHDCPDLSQWFHAETGMTPQDFIDKWSKKLNVR